MNTEPTDADEREWLMREYDKAKPLAPVTKSAKRKAPPPRLGPDHPLVTSIREQLARERRERAKLERQVADLSRTVAELRNEFAVARKLDEITARLDRVEASRSGLRAV